MEQKTGRETKNFEKVCKKNIDRSVGANEAEPVPAVPAEDRG